MPILGYRVWRTTDGRHVLDGDLDAAFLAYGSGDDVPEHIAQQLRPDPEPDSDPGDSSEPDSDSAPAAEGEPDSDPEPESQPEADPEPEAEQKARPPAANKARKAAGNK